MGDVMETYFKHVGKGKLLTHQEEIALAQAIEAGDLEARRKMIESNLRLAISIAKKYLKSGASMEDLIQESNIGLMKAVDRFDWRRGFKFSTYASWWIKQAVRRHVTDNASDIRIPAHMASLAYRVNKLIKEYEDDFKQKPSASEIADILNVSCHLVEEITMGYNMRSLISIDTEIPDTSGKKIADILVDEKCVSPDAKLDYEKVFMAIKRCMKDLSPREEQVLRLRFGISDVMNEDDFPNELQLEEKH
jgi:RNA polymerase primary sigma factor